MYEVHLAVRDFVLKFHVLSVPHKATYRIKFRGAHLKIKSGPGKMAKESRNAERGSITRIAGGTCLYK